MSSYDTPEAQGWQNEAATFAGIPSRKDDEQRLYCPFVSAINPAAELVQRESIAWAKRMNLVQSRRHIEKLDKSKIGYLVSRSFPRGAIVPLQIAADWTTVFCLIDDHIEDIGVPEVAASMLCNWQFAFKKGCVEHAVADDAFAHALVDLHQRMLAASNQEWVDGFADHLGDVFAGFVWESINRAHGVALDQATYRPLREITVGLYPQFHLGILAEGLYLPRHVLQHPILRRLMTSSSLAVGWANDIFTCAKELEAGETHNLVFVVMQEDGLLLHQAIQWASALHDAEVRAFEELARDLPSFGVYHQQVLRFVAILADWIRGHLDWAVETGRYVAPAPHVSESGEFDRADYRMMLDEQVSEPHAHAVGM